MSSKFQILFLVIVFFAVTTSAQTRSIQDIFDEIEHTNDTANKKIFTSFGFNVLIQKRVMNYLTGVSDLSLAKFYGSYSSENDKLNLGFNVPIYHRKQKDFNRLALIINPLFESDVKNNFATIYKEGKWKNNLRGGLKISYLIPFSTFNSNLSDKAYIRIVRTNKFEEIQKLLAKEDSIYSTPLAIYGENFIPSDPDNSKRKKNKKIYKLAEEIGLAEINEFDKRKLNSWMQTSWLSAWTLFPLTEADNYISPDYNQIFTTTKFKLWEINLQGTLLIDNSKYGTLYISPWFKYFQNNSAYADLMTKVDFQQYSQLPNSNYQNLAILETNKAYIGKYKEFLTKNFNFQIVYFAPFKNSLINPGLSFRYEKFYGDYSPTNLRFGLPITIQGKEKPINVEFQYRLNDINNYLVKPDFKQQPTIGLSLGFPFVLLYK